LATRFLQHPALASLQTHARVIGLTGLPGAGKSSLTSLIVGTLRKRGKSVAVLAVDPSSSENGGAVLGDRIRMQDHFCDSQVYIRSMGSRGALGGVSRATRGAIRLIGLLGFDYVIVETVGIGQSEIMAASMTDIFVQLHQPYSGDELQGIKKGVMEIADLIVINKVDIDPNAAMRAQLFITSSLRLLGFQGNPDHASHDQEYWHPTVMTLSALEGNGVPELWEKILHFQKLQNANGKLQARRKQQSGAWMWDRIDAGLKNAFQNHPAVQTLLPGLSSEVNQGTMAASVAARRLLEAMGHEFF
jgi:LAO/AO transport system kinase